MGSDDVLSSARVADNFCVGLYTKLSITGDNSGDCAR